jgi:hypothetical protein
MTGTGIVVVVVSATVVGTSVTATVVGATEVVDSAVSPPPPHADDEIPARAIDRAKKRFEESFTDPLITQFDHQVVDEY